MEEIKVLATDIDGTLINNNHEIPSANRKLIDEIQSIGKHVIVSTGRSHTESIFMFDNEGIVCAKICANGAIVVDEEGKVIYTSPVNRNSIRNCISTLQNLPIYFEVYTNRGCVSLNYLNHEQKEVILSGHVAAGYQRSVESFEIAINARAERGTLHLVQSFDEILSDNTVEFYKIIVVSVCQDKLSELRDEFIPDASLCITRSGSYNIEVNGKDATKGNALRAYAEIYDYDINEVMAIGDSYNDISMFEAAGLAVAMGNAPKDVQVLCDWVTGTNDGTGWADAVEKFVIKNEGIK